MTGFVVPIVIILIGIVASIAMRRASSRTARLLIGIPSMILMMVLFLAWIS